MTRYLGKVCIKHPELGGERLSSSRTCVACNRERPAVKAGVKKYYKSEKGKAYMKKYTATFFPHRSAKRLADIQIQTPPWSDMDRVDEIYSDAVEFREHGLSVHVDHVIPLKGKLVSGLHVPSNLTIKLAEFNLRKSNIWSVI